MSNAQTLRILHIASGDLWAGAEVQLFTLVSTLHRQLGVPVTVALLNHGILERRLREAGIPVIVLDETRLNGFRILRELIRIIRDLNPGVVHTHRHKENILGSFAAALSGNIPSIRTIHGVRKRPPFLQVARRLIHFINWATGYFLQRRIISVSGDLATILAKEFPRDKIRIIENGVNPEDICRQAGEKKNRWRDGIFWVGMIGRLVPVKRVDIFISAAHCLLQQQPNSDIRFYIIGDGPLRGKLETLRHKTGTEKIVHFQGHQDEIFHHIQNLDALVMTSDHEGLPMVLLEAMVLRVPVIAHKIGGIPELLDNGSCGILVDTQDPAAYAREILRLKDNPVLHAQLTKSAYDRVTSRYSARRNAEAYLAEYASLMS